MTNAARHERRLELVSTILLALATVATAWSAYRARFRAEFKPAFAAWIATKPFTDKTAPPTPFAFFAGLSTKMHTLRARTVILGIGSVVFLGSLVWLATLPVKV